MEIESTNFTVYVLECSDQTYYVGKTTKDVKIRFQEHLDGTGCYWTRKHPPIRIVEVHERCSGFDEDKFVKVFMSRYGINKVRGGRYSQLSLSPEDIRLLEKEIASAKDLCYKCGSKGHYQDKCEAIGSTKSPLSRIESRKTSIIKEISVRKSGHPIGIGRMRCRSGDQPPVELQPEKIGSFVSGIPTSQKGSDTISTTKMEVLPIESREDQTTKKQRQLGLSDLRSKSNSDASADAKRLDAKTIRDQFSDISLVSKEGTSHPTVKFLLCQHSEWFLRELAANKEMTHFRVDHPSDVLKLVLGWMYRTSIKITNSNCMNVFRFASEYLFYELERKTFNFMLINFDSFDVVSKADIIRFGVLEEYEDIIDLFTDDVVNSEESYVQESVIEALKLILYKLTRKTSGLQPEGTSVPSLSDTQPLFRLTKHTYATDVLRMISLEMMKLRDVKGMTLFLSLGCHTNARDKLLSHTIGPYVNIDMEDDDWSFLLESMKIIYGNSAV